MLFLNKIYLLTLIEDIKIKFKSFYFKLHSRLFLESENCSHYFYGLTGHFRP